MSLAARDMRVRSGRREAPVRERAVSRRAIAPRRRALASAGPALLAVVLIGVLGLARVAVAARAAEAAMDSGRIMRDIKAERLTGDRLEIDRSALSTPSRIEGIAGEAMRMAPPREVLYLDAGEIEMEEEDARTARAALGDGHALAAFLRAAAAEAQVLLVGDVGLASAR